MDWREAGRAWGARGLDWAYLVEPYARPANLLVFERVGVAPGVRLLDIACGSGCAAMLAAHAGAEVTGIDASAELLEIARARTPLADFRAADMFALPFDDDRFDAATSFNGIWKGCEGALAEARRVVRPGGMVGVTFWGPPKRLGLLPYFTTVAELSPSDHVDATVSQGDTGRPGVIEQMFETAGLRFCARGTVNVVNEWPDIDIAIRALAAAGPSWPAIDAAGYDQFTATLGEALRPLWNPVTGLRITSEFGWATAQVPT